MRNSTLRIVFALTMLVGQLVFIISCGDRSSNNANSAATAESEKIVEPTPLPKACRSGNPSNEQKIDDLYADLARLAIYDADLGDQLVGRPDSQPDPQPDEGPTNFSIVFEEYISSATGQKRVLMRVKGKVIGDENPHSPARKASKLTKLLKFMDRNMQRDCIDAVSFEPELTEAAAAKSVLSERGFEWWPSCEYPNMVCTDGSCRRDCSTKRSPTPKPSPTSSPVPSPTASPTP